MTHVPRETATCSTCGRTFDRVALGHGFTSYFAPVDRQLGVDRPPATCGDCYKLFMDWLDQKPTN